MDHLMHQIIVCCIAFSVFGLCLAVHAKNAVFRIFPDIEKNNNMLEFGSEFLIYDKSVPRSAQRLCLASQFVFFWRLSVALSLQCIIIIMDGSRCLHFQQLSFRTE